MPSPIRLSAPLASTDPFCKSRPPLAKRPVEPSRTIAFWLNAPTAERSAAPSARILPEVLSWLVAEMRNTLPACTSLLEASVISRAMNVSAPLLARPPLLLMLSAVSDSALSPKMVPLFVRLLPLVSEVAPALMAPALLIVPIAVRPS